jgi:hypothetical protein
MLLYNYLIKLYKNDKSQLSSILGIFYNIKTDFQIINKFINKYLHFKNQLGGEIKNLSINNNKYYYNLLNMQNHLISCILVTKFI